MDDQPPALPGKKALVFRRRYAQLDGKLLLGPRVFSLQAHELCRRSVVPVNVA
jgi:hypothetical protein